MSMGATDTWLKPGPKSRRRVSLPFAMPGRRKPLSSHLKSEPDARTNKSFLDRGPIVNEPLQTLAPSSQFQTTR